MYPAGRIKIKHRNYGTYYYHSVQDKADKFIDNSQLVEDLIQKSYLEKVIKSAQNEIEVLNTFLDSIRKLQPKMYTTNSLMTAKSGSNPLSPQMSSS